MSRRGSAKARSRARDRMAVVQNACAYPDDGVAGHPITIASASRPRHNGRCFCSSHRRSRHERRGTAFVGCSDDRHGFGGRCARLVGPTCRTRRRKPGDEGRETRLGAPRQAGESDQAGRPCPALRKAGRPERPSSRAPRPSLPSRPRPADPLSFGMKWNGSNDNAAQTRIENLNGNATGTGAEVGMKLHF